jgi:hypothetical protein
VYHLTFLTIEPAIATPSSQSSFRLALVCFYFFCHDHLLHLMMHLEFATCIMRYRLRALSSAEAGFEHEHGRHALHDLRERCRLDT